MDSWLTETHTDGYRVNWKLKEIIYTEQSKFQKISIVDTVEFGRALVLDDIIQTTEKDEFIYHEMITHIALFTHPKPHKVLVIGGGDGGTVREVLKHQAVEKVVLVEIDERVIELSKKYIPQICSSLDDPRVEIRTEDGIAYINGLTDGFDIIIVDSSDPIGPAVNLFARGFYRQIYKALEPDGIMVAQTESPWFNRDLFKNVNLGLSQIFPIARPYLTAIPTYYSGFWSFTMASKKYDPLYANLNENQITKIMTKYYTSEIHRAAFVLPKFVQEILKRNI